MKEAAQGRMAADPAAPARAGEALTVALVQMTSGIDPVRNIAAVEEAVAEAARAGARLVLTPEMTTLLDRSRRRILETLAAWPAARQLAPLADAARRHGLWLVVGSIPVLDGRGEKAWNRSVVIAPDGRIAACYDKIHLFDVDLGDGEAYGESRLFHAGRRAVVAAVAGWRVGLTVCYDLRFPQLYRALALAGAEILMVPAAFTRPTGRAHWRTLLKARAIENGAFVLAAAQTGEHEDGRATYGHSMAVAPWGEVLVEAGEEPGVVVTTLERARLHDARRRIPVLDHGREFVVVEAGGHASCRAAGRDDEAGNG
ncbi:MAG: amidohydrolase [Rhodothalassiaceae bacterium]|nr:MAG: amidohydrolase [Rhodothalassiaceae bacterium]